MDYRRAECAMCAEFEKGCISLTFLGFNPICYVDRSVGVERPGCGEFSTHEGVAFSTSGGSAARIHGVQSAWYTWG